MNNNLHSLFSGAFYIDASYAMACIPSLYQSFVKGDMSDESKNSIVSKIQSEKFSNDSTSTQRVAIINFNQPVVKYRNYDWLGTQDFISILESIKNNPEIVGVVFNVDSGGGQVYGTAEFYDYIKSFPKPTATYTGGLLCSAAYYFANATNFIVANKRADSIGSIGAYSHIVDSSGILEHFGAKIHTMYGTKSTEKNAEYREVIENSNYEPYIKNILDPMIEDFHADMIASRPQLNEIVFKGGTWKGSQSLELGLIDEIGTLQTAIDKVFELAKTQTTNQNTNNMSKEINAPKIMNVLGYETPFQSNENGVFLQEAEIETIETALANSETAVVNANEALATIIAERNTISETVTDANAIVDAALTTAEIYFTPEMSLTEKITLIENQRKEFSSKSAGGKTTLVNDADDLKDDKKQVVYAHDEEAMKILNLK